jgi:hypothetical protein
MAEKDIFEIVVNDWLSTTPLNRALFSLQQILTYATDMPTQILVFANSYRKYHQRVSNRYITYLAAFRIAAIASGVWLFVCGRWEWALLSSLAISNVETLGQNLRPVFLACCALYRYEGMFLAFTTRTSSLADYQYDVPIWIWCNSSHVFSTLVQQTDPFFVFSFCCCWYPFTLPIPTDKSSRSFML